MEEVRHLIDAPHMSETARQLLSQDLADFSSCALSQLAAAAAPAAPAEGRPDKVLEEQAAEEVVEVAVADPPDGVLPLPK